MFSPPRPLVISAALAVWLLAAPASGQLDLSVERELLEKLHSEGKYKQASLEALRVEQILKQGGGSKSGPATKLRVELLAYKARIDRLMGNLDAAEKSLTEAERLFGDREFQRWITAQAPRSDDNQAGGQYWVPWSLLYFSLLDERALILVERADSVNQQLAVAGTKGSDEQQTQVIKWFKTLDDLTRTQMNARSTSLARISADETPLPHVDMLLGGTRPRLIAGLRYLEASKLPYTLPSDAADAAIPKSDQPPAETPEQRAATTKRQRRRAVEYLEKAAEDASAACATAIGRLEKDAGGSRSAELAKARAESARIRAEVREPLAEALLLDGSVDRARSIVDPLIADLRATERERHPSLARPLILSARIALEEATLGIAAKDAVEAESRAKAASEALSEAKVLLEMEDSEFDRSAPLHAALATMITASNDLLRKSGQLVAAKDAADAAARRALQAIKAGEGRRKP